MVDRGANVNESKPPAAFRRLFEPLTIGSLTLRNRIVNTMHGSGLGEARDLRYLQERARGGASLLGVHASGGVYGYTIGPGPRTTSVDWDAKGISPLTAEGIAHYDDAVIPALRMRADVIHAEGAKCFAQVYHLGAARHGAHAGPVLAPSSVQDPYEALVPHALTEEEIEELIVCFAHAIRRTREAGLDAAEIHGAHGYLVNEFLSPYFNRRTDAWGGTRDNRARFVVRMIEAARAMVGADFPIGIRIGVDGDGDRRGITIDELAAISGLLAPHVAYISVSGGNYAGFGDGLETAYVSPWYKDPAFNVAAAAAVKRVVDVPVIVTGRILDPSIAEGILADGAADMIGMVRALIADPDLPNKARAGRTTEIRMCIGMSECHHIGPHRVPITCAVNAAAIENETVPLHECDVASFDRMQNINVRGTFLSMKHEIITMLAGGGGKIVNIASTNSVRPQPNQPAYTASKHAVLGLTRSAAIDYAKHNIRVNAICPGSIDTPMLRGAMERRGRREEEVVDRLSLIGRFGRPEEIASAALWLCSDDSSFVLGHGLAVDAGYLAR